ncbi:hypothetical protein FE810_13800 [Thalassotalea litorea]|uniref:Uncharacterized protein n=1 Tax=Thalassotalea litorea TaxID=2020715 RepID=A0A5R9IE61_9GAMM|nr:hypothetical protein [Thalassotalea litorea]TLU61885.1 hypothetical protein FE810_13800 [Thalassotalea litorea]
MKNSIIAFIFAPSAAPLIYSLFNFVATSGGSPDLGGALIIAGICYIWALFPGILLVKLMERQKWFHWWQYFLVGFVSGTPFALFWYSFGGSMIFTMFISAGFVAGVTAVLFWLITKLEPTIQINKDIKP